MHPLRAQKLHQLCHLSGISRYWLLRALSEADARLLYIKIKIEIENVFQHKSIFVKTKKNVFYHLTNKENNPKLFPHV